MEEKEEEDEIRKFLLIVYSVISTKTILERLFEHMPNGGKYNNMKITDTTFISFYSEDDILDIKESLMELFEKPPLFFLFDISDDLREDTFEIHFDTVENTILLDFDLFNDNAELSIDLILELIDKNGFGSLTEKQIKFIQDYSKEDEE